MSWSWCCTFPLVSLEGDGVHIINNSHRSLFVKTTHDILQSVSVLYSYNIDDYFYKWLCAEETIYIYTKDEFTGTRMRHASHSQSEFSSH